MQMQESPDSMGISEKRIFIIRARKICSDKGIMETYYVYMMVNKHNSVLYIGVTNNLIRRVYEHKMGLIDGFTKKYNCHKLIWFLQMISLPP